MTTDPTLATWPQGLIPQLEEAIDRWIETHFEPPAVIHVRPDVDLELKRALRDDPLGPSRYTVDQMFNLRFHGIPVVCELPRTEKEPYRLLKRTGTDERRAKCGLRLLL